MTVSLLHAEDPEAHSRAVPDVRRHRRQGVGQARASGRYGFTPLRLPADLDFTALFHGVDERVPIDALEFSAQVFDRFLDLA